MNGEPSENLLYKESVYTHNSLFTIFTEPEEDSYHHFLRFISKIQSDFLLIKK